MRLNQLRDYLDALLATGVDPNMPVCIHDDDPAIEAMEVCNAGIYLGEFREDPSPKLCGFLQSSGKFLMLQTCLDYDLMMNANPHRFAEVETGVEVPAKSWPNGHWFDEPRRADGQS